MVPHRRVRPNLGCGHALTVFIALLGGIAFWVAVRHAADDPVTAPSVWVPGAIGTALLVAALAYQRTARRVVREYGQEERIRAENPDSPWLWVRAWRSPRLPCETSRGERALWLFTGVWNAISLPALAQVISDPARKPEAWFVLLFPIVGFGLLAGALRRTLRRRKYGRVFFAPVSLPGLIGGHLGGVIEIPARVVPLGDMRVTLRCIRRTVVGTGKNRSTREAVIWEREKRIPPEQLAASVGLTNIPVLFEIPVGLPASDTEASDNQVLWRLVAEAETPGIDFLATFHLPVFPAGGPGLPAPLPASSSPDATARPLDDAGLARAGVLRLADGWRFSAPHLRAARLISSLAFLGLLALSGTLILRGSPFPVLLFVAFPLLFTALIAYDLWHAHGELRITADEIVLVRARWFRDHELRLPRATVGDIRVENSVRFGPDQYYRLSLIGRTPDTAAAPRLHARFARHLPGPAFVESIRHEILDRLSS